jgi:RHS repeat-associated protein
MQRTVATIHPNHCWDKIVFDPWQQTTYDQNDTVLTDPATDPDVSFYLSKLPEGDFHPTWYEARINGQMGLTEKAAAAKTAAHSNTPAVVHVDSLGRTILAIADNGPNGKYESRVRFDIVGNKREIIDANGRLVLRSDFDMLQNDIHHASMEAGERWSLQNVVGSVFLAWNSRKVKTRTRYDALHRQIATYVQMGTTSPEQLTERFVFGESLDNPEVHNSRGRTVQVFDQAGVVVNDEYDFKGNLLKSQRQFAQEYKKTLDWSIDIPVEEATYWNTSTYDALSRVVEVKSPDNSITRLLYSDANLPDQIHFNHRGEESAGELVFSAYVSNIDYNEKGQRTLVEYGNGVRTSFAFDPFTFLLTDMKTQRTGETLQDLHYTYDPVQNITQVDDNAQQTVYFRNTVVSPSCEYTYDPLYRLVAATGREHLGLDSRGLPNAPSAPDAWNDAPTRLVSPGDGNALGLYSESYVYDGVDNILSMKHSGSDPSKPGWTRVYTYAEPSQLEPNKKSNRLTSTAVGSVAEIYNYNHEAGIHGMMNLPHFSSMTWDYRDQLQSTSRQSVNSGTPEQTYYVYDTSGQRVRKVTERYAADGQTPSRLKERLYLGVFETYREYAGDGTTISLERETTHIMDQKERVAMIETRTQGEDPSPEQLVRYQFTSFLGTTLLELDDQARIISYEEYYPFGSTSYQYVRSQLETAKRYRYTGKERDDETGLYYHGARYYAPWLGRWISCDPKGLEDGPNLYQYVQNNPISRHDPTGTSWTGKGVGFMAALVVGAVVGAAVTVATAGLAGPAVIAVAAGIASGFAGGAVGSMAEQYIDKGTISAKETLIDGAIGGAIGGLTAGAAPALKWVAKTKVGEWAASGAKAVANSPVGKMVGRVATSAAKKVSSGAVAAAEWAGETAVGKGAKNLATKAVEKVVKPVAGWGKAGMKGLNKAGEWLGDRIGNATRGRNFSQLRRMSEQAWNGGAKVGSDRVAAVAEVEQEGEETIVRRSMNGENPTDPKYNRPGLTHSPKASPFRLLRKIIPTDVLNRWNDAEVHILDELANLNPNSSATLVTTKALCASCNNCVQQWIALNEGLTVNTMIALPSASIDAIKGAAARGLQIAGLSDIGTIGVRSGGHH